MRHICRHAGRWQRIPKCRYFAVAYMHLPIFCIIFVAVKQQVASTPAREGTPLHIDFLSKLFTQAIKAVPLPQNHGRRPAFLQSCHCGRPYCQPARSGSTVSFIISRRLADFSSTSRRKWSSSTTSPLAGIRPVLHRIYPARV